MQKLYKLSSFYNCFINRWQKKNITLSESPLISIVKTAVNKHKTDILLWHSYLLGAFKVTRANSFCIEPVIILIDSMSHTLVKNHHEVDNRSTESLDLTCNYSLTRNLTCRLIDSLLYIWSIIPLPPSTPRLGLQTRHTLPLFKSTLTSKRKKLAHKACRGVFWQSNYWCILGVNDRAVAKIDSLW